MTFPGAFTINDFQPLFLNILLFDKNDLLRSNIFQHCKFMQMPWIIRYKKPFHYCHINFSTGGIASSGTRGRGPELKQSWRMSHSPKFSTPWNCPPCLHLNGAPLILLIYISIFSLLCPPYFLFSFFPFFSSLFLFPLFFGTPLMTLGDQGSQSPQRYASV